MSAAPIQSADSERLLRFCTVEGFKNTKATFYTKTVDELFDSLDKARGKSKDGLAILCKLKDGTTRKSVNAESWSMLLVDIDGVEREFEQICETMAAQGFRCYVYTTWNHGNPSPDANGEVKWEPGMTSCRVVLPLSRDVTSHDEYRALWAATNRWMASMGVDVDPQTKDLSRLMYLPREKNPLAIVEPQRRRIDGVLLDPDLLMAKWAPPAPLTTKKPKVDIPKTSGTLDPDNDLSRIEDALSFISADDRDTWLKVGMALHSEGISQAVWDSWAQSSAKFDQAMQDSTWNGFNPNGGTGIGTVIKWARDAGWEDPRQAVTFKASDLWGEDWGNPTKTVKAAAPTAPKAAAPTKKKKREGIPTDIDDMLTFIDADDVNLRRKIGAILKQEGADRALWDAWAQSSPGYDPNQWDMLPPDPNFGIGLIVSLAKEGGWRHKWDRRKDEVYFDIADMLIDGQAVNLTDEGLHGVFDDGVSTALVQNVLFKQSDTGLIYDRGQVWRCQEAIWAPWTTDHTSALVMRWSRNQQIQKTVQSGDIEISVPVAIKNSVGVGKAFEAFIRGEYAKTDVFDNAPHGLAVGDYFYHVDLKGRTIEAEPLHWSHYQTARATPTPAPENARVTVDDLLEGWFPGDDESKRIILEFVGCAILGIATRYSRALILYGKEGRGKSTFLKIVGKMLPDGFSTALSIANIEGNHTNVGLVHSRVNTCFELADKSDRGVSIQSPETLKGLISGDAVQFNPKYQQPFTAIPRAAYMFAVNPNCFPTVSGGDEAFRNRWMCVEFAAPVDYRVDGAGFNVLEHFNDYAEELVHRCIDAARGVVERHGYSSNERGQALLRKHWWATTDTVSAFVHACLVKRERQIDGATPSVMRTAYEEFCQSQGYRYPVAGAAFKSALARAGVEQDENRSRGVTRYSHRVITKMEREREALAAEADEIGAPF